eukprot:s5349_g3.t1
MTPAGGKIWMIHTTALQDGLSLESSQGLDAEVASLSNRLVDLTQKFASMENDTARYHETMKLLAHERHGYDAMWLGGATVS